MPTYEYKCDNCLHEFETYQTMKDDKLTKCPNCAQNTLKRLIGSGGGLIFKGSGFYLTDYKNKPSETTSQQPDKNAAQKETSVAKPESSDSSEAKVTESKKNSSEKISETKSDS